VTPTFFPTPADFRRWLEQHHESESELLVGFYKKGSGKPSITWPESVDEALSFGWIDGVRKRIDDESYTIRFTPRKEASNWSAINIKRVGELTKLGRMHPAGLRAFEQRKEDKSRIYSYENAPRTLPPEMELQFRKKNRKAWEWYSAQPPSYRRVTTFWVVSAKREETRAKRLAALIEYSAEERRIGLEPVKTKKSLTPGDMED
jgi:uncharacterized protein YdeI (YjbR/CyaY-like superfamily)